MKKKLVVIRKETRYRVDDRGIPILPEDSLDRVFCHYDNGEEKSVKDLDARERREFEIALMYIAQLQMEKRRNCKWLEATVLDDILKMRDIFIMENKKPPEYISL